LLRARVGIAGAGRVGGYFAVVIRDRLSLTVCFRDLFYSLELSRCFGTAGGCHAL